MLLFKLKWWICVACAVVYLLWHPLDSDTWRIDHRWLTLSQTGRKFVAHVSKNPHIVALYFQLVLSHQGNIMDVISWNGKTLKSNVCAISRRSTFSFIANLHPRPSPPRHHHHHSFLLSVILLSLSASIFPFVFIYSFVCSCTLHSHSLLRVLWQTCPPLLHSLLLNKVTAKWL